MHCRAWEVITCGYIGITNGFNQSVILPFCSHEELLAMKGVYAEMWNNQISNEDDGTGTAPTTPVSREFFPCSDGGLFT